MYFRVFCLLALLTCGLGAAPEQVAPGVWRFRFGEPEKITPVSTRHYAPAMDGLAALPLDTTTKTVSAASESATIKTLFMFLQSPPRAARARSSFARPPDPVSLGQSPFRRQVEIPTSSHAGPFAWPSRGVHDSVTSC